MVSDQNKLSWKSRAKIFENGSGSCYYCLMHFFATDIKEWVDGGLTALCPICGIDSVVPGRIDSETLLKWNEESFQTTVPFEEDDSP